MSAPATVWDQEYGDGRLYDGMPPLGYMDNVVKAVADAGSLTCLHIGCGNGRNDGPLLEAGLAVTAVDISGVALEQYEARFPGRSRLVLGDLRKIEAGAEFDLVLAIHVHQHGTRRTAHKGIREAQAYVAPGGLFALVTQATGWNLHHGTEVYERARDGSYTLRYTVPRWRRIHAFSEPELTGLFAGFEQLMLERHEGLTYPQPTFTNARWEGIWRRP